MRLAVAITSGMGSISDLGSGNAMMYRVSKAGLNMAMVARAKTFAAQGITVAVINPGWVKTDMGGENAHIDVDTSVRGLVDQVNAYTGKGGHHFVDYKGDTITW